MKVEVRPIRYSEALFAPIFAEAENAGGAFMLKVRDEWIGNVQRFEGPGEFLLGAFANDELVAVGGVTRDPYDDQPGLGRVRHIYVLKGLRGQGIGRTLMSEIVDRARLHWQMLRLRTNEAGRFYERLGFTRTSGKDETHRLNLSR